jgi:Mitochondrial genome maintenance MGM101
VLQDRRGRLCARLTRLDTTKMLPSRVLSRGLSGFSRASHAKLSNTVSSARVHIPQRHSQWQRLARYATTTTGEANSENAESSLDAEQEIEEEVSARIPPNGTVNGNGVNGGIIPEALGDGGSTDWSRSYYGLSSQPFPKEIAEILEHPIDPADIEMKPGV